MLPVALGTWSLMVVFKALWHIFLPGLYQPTGAVHEPSCMQGEIWKGTTFIP